MSQNDRIQHLSDRLADAVEALDGQEEIAKQLFTALERIDQAINDYFSGEVEAEVAIDAIQEILYPFFVEPDE